MIVSDGPRVIKRRRGGTAMSRRADRKAVQREARARRAERRLFWAAWRYAAKFDLSSREPLLNPLGESETAEVPSVVELLAELEVAVLHFAATIPAPSPRRRRRRA